MLHEHKPDVSLPRLHLSDNQLRLVMITAEGIPHEKRNTFLLRFAAILAYNSSRITDVSVREAAELSQRSLMARHSSGAA